MPDNTEKVVRRVREVLASTRLTPRMYAWSREALMSRVSALMEIAIDGFEVRSFYDAHLVRSGCAYVGCDENYEDSWAHEVIDDAVSKLP